MFCKENIKQSIRTYISASRKVYEPFSTMPGMFQFVFPSEVSFIFFLPIFKQQTINNLIITLIHWTLQKYPDCHELVNN